jgi:alpha-tubulin suppressor-like RCC1 family protein
MLGLKQSPPIAQLTVSDGSACVLYAGPGSSSSVQCWGFRLGVQTEQAFVPQAVGVPGTCGAVSISLGTYAACAVMNTGTVACWRTDGIPMIAAEVPGLNNVVKVAASGSSANCAIVHSAGETDSLWCWGKLGGGFISNSSTPRMVSGLPGNVTDIALGVLHACALVDNSNDRSGGDVYCWGANHYAQLGQGYYNATNTSYVRPPSTATPMRVKGLSRVRALYTGGSTTCAVTAFQQVLCWGDNGSGQLPVDPAAQVELARRGFFVVPSPAVLTGVCVHE